ncbi:protein SSXA1-like [Leptonychotes weddellii]|uniref:Protein SSXA1-like n=1 Tax=Leptonychotes weddellii TaxID=9713 RepID=A0A7F8R8F2_LEPWE|nr:protein SSXA1-like [Leptonychotes weddellii]XP_030889500.1 protein SSXA1-like [Leptonychotes weddellii]
MNKDSSFSKNSKEDTQKPEKKCKAFKDISKYFSKEEWAKLGYSDKITYVYMKRNYDTMTGLGLRATLPAFMCPKKRAMKSSGHDSDEGQDRKNQGEPRQGPSDAQDREQMKVMLKKPIKEESDSEPIPITPGPEQAQKELCPPGKASTSGQQSENIPGPRRGMNSIWAYRLRERKNLIVYEEISDPEEDD